MTSSQLLAARLRTQHLIGPSLPTASAVVGKLGCVQSQDPFGANWSLAMRARGATEASILAAYDRGEFLRTHILRPTWHYVLPTDIRWILGLTAPKILRGNRTMERRLGLDPKRLARAFGMIERALEGGNHLTREEVSGVLARGGFKAEGQRLQYLMMAAELNAVVCSGAMQGKRHTYALLDERAGGGRKVGESKKRDEGIAELFRRFVVGHAPTTLKQFCWWSWLTVKEARQAREALKGELEGESIDGVEWMLAESRSTRSQEPRALLIPEYDEVLVGTADIGIPRLMADRRIPGRTTNTFDRPILTDGKWVGTWRRVFAGKGIVLEAELFARPNAASRALLERERDHYAKFSGVRVEVRVTTR